MFSVNCTSDLTYRLYYHCAKNVNKNFYIEIERNLKKYCNISSMRPTQLNFRSPHERTAEFKKFSQTHLGTDLNFLKKTMNQSGSILPKEQRFKD